MKIIMYFVLYAFPKYDGKVRPGLIVDMQGEDHRLIRNANPKADSFFRKNRFDVKGLGNRIKNYAPRFAKESAHNEDIIFGFSLNDFEKEDLRCLEIENASMRKLFKFIKANKKIADDIRAFYREFEDYPTSRHDPEPIYLKDMGLLNYQVHDVLVDNLELLRDNKVTVPSYSKYHKDDFVDEMRKGTVVIINMHQMTEHAPLYLGPIQRDLYKYARKNDREALKIGNKKILKYTPPAFFIEEADLLLDKHDIKKRKSSTKWTIEFLRRGFKYGIFLCIVTQDANSLHHEVKKHMNTVQGKWLLGSVTNTDKRMFSRMFTPRTMEALSGLDQSPDTKGAREWLLVYDSRNFDTVRPFSPPFEMHIR